MYKTHVWILLFSIFCQPCFAEKSDWDDGDQPYAQYVPARDPAKAEPVAAEDRTRISRDQILGAPVEPAPPENIQRYAEPDPVDPPLTTDGNLTGSQSSIPVKKRNFFFDPAPIPWLDKSVDAIGDGIAAGAKGSVRAVKSTGRVIKENKAAIAKGVLITGVTAGAVTGGYFLLRNANKQSGDVSPAVQYVPGYTTANGVKVPGYYKTVADDNPYNNFSTYGNFNPYTQQWGTIKPPGWP